MLSSRVAIVKQIGKYKKDNNVTALQINRWTQLMESRVNMGKAGGEMVFGGGGRVLGLCGRYRKNMP